MIKLGIDKIKSATFGALTVSEKDGLIEFFRFSEKQRKFNELNPDDVRVNNQKSLATSSVTIDFYSDTENLSLKIKTFVSTGQTKCYVDLLVDGKLFAHDGYDGDRDGQIDFDLRLNKGNKRITIYLCNLFKCAIESMAIDDQASFCPITDCEKFLFVGDSITQGYTSVYPSNSYVNSVARAFNAHAINQSIGGAFFNADMLDDNLGFIPDKIFIAYGTNDWSKRDDLFVRADAFCKRVTELFNKSEIIALTPIWRGDIKLLDKNRDVTFSEMQDNLKAIFHKYPNIKVVDGVNLVPHDEKYFIQDILHPNDDGFREYAKNLLSILKGDKTMEEKEKNVQENQNEESKLVGGFKSFFKKVKDTLGKVDAALEKVNNKEDFSGDEKTEENKD